MRTDIEKPTHFNLDPSSGSRHSAQRHLFRLPGDDPLGSAPARTGPGILLTEGPDDEGASLAAVDADTRRAGIDAGRDATMGAAARDWVLAQVEYGDAPAWLYRFDRVRG